MVRSVLGNSGAYLPVSRQNISHFGREKVRGIKALFRFKAPPENPRVGGSIPPLATINFLSFLPLAIGLCREHPVVLVRAASNPLTIRSR
jgi:hypothetical protein